MLKTKHIAFDFKSTSPSGAFQGLLSPYGNVDEGGDRIMPGAYTRTLYEKGNTRPLLWQHQTDMPIGELTLEDRPDGLWCKGQLLMALPEAKRAYELLKAGIVTGLSIGFQTMRDEIKDGVRNLKEVKLFEGSIVTFPMNEMAQISSVKASALDHDRIQTSLKNFRDDILRELKGQK
jgi:HK97 family phage prohead protease